MLFKFSFKNILLKLHKVRGFVVGAARHSSPGDAPAILRRLFTVRKNIYRIKFGSVQCKIYKICSKNCRFNVMPFRLLHAQNAALTADNKNPSNRFTMRALGNNRKVTFSLQVTIFFATDAFLYWNFKQQICKLRVFE